MNRKTKLISLFIVALSIALPFMLYKKEVKTEPDLRIGWVSTWAAAGQIMVALDRADTASDFGLNLEVVPYVLGPQINEAGLRGEVDVIVVGSVPTATLLSTSDDWTVVARIVDFFLSTIVHPESGISSINDLARKTVAVPFGAGAHPYFVSLIRSHGLSLEERSPNGVRLVNMRPPEQVVALQRGTVDAVATWEPASSILTGEGHGLLLHEEKHSGFVILRNSILETRPHHAMALVKAIEKAHLYNAQNREEVDRWFSEDSGFEEKLLKNMKVIEASFTAKTIDEIDISLNAEAIAHGQKIIDDMYELGLLNRKVVFSERLATYLQ